MARCRRELFSSSLSLELLLLEEGEADKELGDGNDVDDDEEDDE